MKIGFNRENSNGIEKAACVESTSLSKKGRINELKNNMKYNKKRLKNFKKEMQALAFLRGSYSYNSEFLNVMIGQCFTELHQTKNTIREYQRMIKEFKSTKESK